MIDKDEQRMIELGAKLISNSRCAEAEESTAAIKRLAEIAKENKIEFGVDSPDAPTKMAKGI